ncbi:MAG: FMN-binding negative transcriptional regulator [Bryobacteraceae bacterium]
MNRRQLLYGFLAAAWEGDAQEPAPGSLYIPKPQRVEDKKLLMDFMDEFAFVDLVTATPEIRVTHLPVFVDHTGTEYGTVFGHISRHNPQTNAIAAGQPAVIVFRGPHSYISPTWYAGHEVVPTWNFAVLHATGTLRPETDAKATHDLLARLIRKFEGKASAYDFSKLPESFTNSLISGVLGFRMEIQTLEGKFKLGQERSEADKQSVLRHLHDANQGPSMYEFTESFYRRG